MYDYKSLPVDLVATFVVGLREDSRVMMKLTNRRLDFNQSVGALTFDALNGFIWAHTKDAKRNKNKPKGIYNSIYEDKKDKEEVIAFNSGDDFRERYNKIVKG